MALVGGHVTGAERGLGAGGPGHELFAFMDAGAGGSVILTSGQQQIEGSQENSSPGWHRAVLE